MKKRADGRYQRAITIDGKKKFFYGTSPAEVNRKILNYEKKREQGRTFEEVAEEWYSIIVETISPTTIRGYLPAKNDAVAVFGKTLIKDITAQDINRYLTKLSAKKMAYKTVLTKLQIVRQVLDYAIIQGELSSNPASIVKVPKGLSKTKRETVSESDIVKIKNSIGNTFYIFALTALYTGCRRGEILALQYEDFDFKNNTISINKSVYHQPNAPHIKKPKTQAGIRTVPLLEPLKQVIEPLKIKGYLFANNGKLLSNQQAVTLWEHYCKETGINITPHQLRHAYATRLYELDIDEKSAQDLLGHADIHTTKNIYTHITNQKRKLTADKLINF